jgi:hypothetical protein
MQFYCVGCNTHWTIQCSRMLKYSITCLRDFLKSEEVISLIRALLASLSIHRPIFTFLSHCTDIPHLYILNLIKVSFNSFLWQDTIMCPPPHHHSLIIFYNFIILHDKTQIRINTKAKCRCRKSINWQASKSLVNSSRYYLFSVSFSPVLILKHQII